MEGEHQKQAHDNPTVIHTQRINKGRSYNEVQSRNVLDQHELKKRKVELQGKFRKIKPPTFDG